MRPMDEQHQFDELNANRRVKLAPKKVFETSLNDARDCRSDGKGFWILEGKGLDAPFLFIRTK
jgi:hypothetical protein